MENKEEHYEAMMQSVERYCPSADMAEIQKAYEYADKKHAGQLRKSGEPYIIHPLAVAEIVVTPTKQVRPGALLESVDLRPGQSLWRIDPTELAGRLESHPWIRRATVRREFPRRLVVDVVERKPVAILYLDQLYYVDSTGLAFVRVGERDPLDLPFVTGVVGFCPLYRILGVSTCPPPAARR